MTLRRIAVVGLAIACMLTLFPSPATAAEYSPADEMFFYAEGGSFAYYNVSPSGVLGSAIRSGTNYRDDWTSVEAVDPDGDGQDEMFFYAEGGLYAYYNVSSSGAVGTAIRTGTNYLDDWTSVAAVDLDGDGQDEMFFYAEGGLYAYYNVSSSGAVGTAIRTGTNYRDDWTSVEAVDLDGDGQDEMFFYAEDGRFAYYNVSSTGAVGTAIRTGTGYVKGWTSVVAVDLDGDDQDEMFFYAEDGRFAYYNVSSTGVLGTAIRSGTGYVKGWTSVVGVDLDFCKNPFTSARVASLKAQYPGQSFTAHVYDTRSGCTFTLNPSLRLRTASVFKVMVMAGTLLEAQNDGRWLTSWELSQITPMITESANDPVYALWSHFGGSPWFADQADIFGLESTVTVGDSGGAWGTTTTSADDQVELLRQVLLGHWGPLDPEYREEAWDQMTSVVPSQTWGITAGVPAGWTVAQKNGFAGHIANSVGFVQAPGSDEGYVIAVLTNWWPTWTSGVSDVEEISEWVSDQLATPLG